MNRVLTVEQLLKENSELKNKNENLKKTLEDIINTETAFYIGNENQFTHQKAWNLCIDIAHDTLLKY